MAERGDGIGLEMTKTIIRGVRLARDQSELRIVADQHGCPTHAGDLAAALGRVLATDLRGVVHATGSGSCTGYEFACAIVSFAGLSVKGVPLTTAERSAERRGGE